MEISLEQAIEIHARALKKRHKHRAPEAALERAEALKYANALEGHAVWMRVAEIAESLSQEPEGPTHILHRR